MNLDKASLIIARMKALTALLVFVCQLSPASAQDSSPAQLLFVTQSSGYRHTVIPEAVRILRDRAPAFGIRLRVTEDFSAISADDLAELDGILFFTTGELPLSPAQKTAFLDFIRSGKGFAGVHSATDTFYDWPEYGKIIGGYFNGHPWSGEPVGIIVENQDHPSTAHMGISERIIDEIYQFRDLSPAEVDVLISLDVTSVDMARPGVNPVRDFPLSWTNTYGEGRIFYTAFGHFPSVWKAGWFQEHLFNGLLWSMKRK